jgi:23S rRNA (cytidine1920-2'-O)/16S rRNA (cytidine1409-2'-O)-methyltransferase
LATGAASGDDFVSRSGAKLAAALDVFPITISGRVCADLGSNVGGFVDCLLQRGAARVHAIEKGYGVLDYRLRRDPRVVVHERANALHMELPEMIDVLTCDLGWTRQRHIVPVADRLLAADGDVVSLVKPHYEAPRANLRRGVLPSDRVNEVLADIVRVWESAGWRVVGQTESPIAGRAGNREVFLHVRRRM